MKSKLSNEAKVSAMALHALQRIAVVALCCCSYSFAELFGSNISFPLINIHSDASPFGTLNSTRSERIKELLKGDTKRQQTLFRRKENPSHTLGSEGQLPLASGAAISNGNYIIKMGFGTPAQSIYTIIDTGSDIAWIPCNSCNNCTTNQVFQAEKSSTLKMISCSSEQCGQVKGMCMGGDKCQFSEIYVDGSEVTALLSSDEITAGGNPEASKNVRVSRFTFGCSNVRKGVLESAPGLVGLGRGTLSFLSQTEALYEKVFSYCLPSVDSMAFSGSLSVGKGRFEFDTRVEVHTLVEKSY